MQTFVTLLTTFAVSLHAMLGCCAHHSHGCSPLEKNCSAHSALGHAESDCSKRVDFGHSCSHKRPHVTKKRAFPESTNKSAISDSESCGSDHQHHGLCSEPNCSFASTERFPDVERVIVRNFDIEQLCSSMALKGYAAAERDNLNLPPVPPDMENRGLSLRAHLQIWRL